MKFNCYCGKKVLVTGHTGFKGSWLSLWLEMLGAKVIGFALRPPTTPNHFDCLDLAGESIIADIRELETLKKVVLYSQPDLVFHLAAQPLVHYSYTHPIETLETNIMGTANLLEACRFLELIRGVVVVTSDKCYADSQHRHAFKEGEPLGGDDPYSCSKACAELVTDAYRKSYFARLSASEGRAVIASARAGNVIGGGDWGEDRLLPDIVHALVNDTPIVLRNPTFVRPWQHVLDALSGYLLLGEQLIENQLVDSSWNFGPETSSTLSVLELLHSVSAIWGKPIIIRQEPSALKESEYLSLDTSKVRKRLGWQPIWDVNESVRRTVDWYKAYYERGSIISRHQIKDYMDQAAKNQH